MLASYRASNGLPGPRPTPLMGPRGNLLLFMKNPVKHLGSLYRRYGEIVSLTRCTTEYVFVFSPEYNQQLLSNTALFFNLDVSSSPLRIPKNSSLSRLFTGLTQMNGARHKQQRQLMIPALQKKRIENYYNAVVAVTEQKLAGWRVGQQRDLFQEMRGLTLSIAVRALVGLDPNRGGDEMCQLLERWTSLVFSLWTIMLPFDFPGFSYHRLLTLSDNLERLLQGIIERKRIDGLDHSDALSALMQVHDEDQRQLTDDELIGQTNFLFMAGHATTASALTWTMFLLAQHPRTMNDLLDECENKFRGAAPTMEQLDELPLLDAAIKESLRLLPPVLWWSRVSTAPFTLGQYALPRGTRVVHSAYITHRIADLYPQPNKFLPERWFSINPGPYEYLPFSAGPRACLGYAFAMMEIKLVLALLLRRFHFSLAPGTKVDVVGPMLSAPKRGMPVLIGQQDRRRTSSKLGGNIHHLVDLH
jgi:cytochrome P450